MTLKINAKLEKGNCVATCEGNKPRTKSNPCPHAEVKYNLPPQNQRSLLYYLGNL